MAGLETTVTQHAAESGVRSRAFQQGVSPAPRL